MMAVRWGICSAGKISHDFVVGLKSGENSQDHVVAAVAARSHESAAKFAETHGIPKVYGSYDQLAEDPDIDIVYIGTIHPTHLECTRKMFEKGKPVLCEKPLTMNVADTESLISSAKEKGLFFMEGVWMRFFPAMVELRRQIEEGVIGEVKFVSASFGFQRREGASRLTEPQLGGGAMLDIGIYLVNFTSMVFDGMKPESIQASGWLTSGGVDECSAFTLKYPGQRVAQLVCSTCLGLPNEAIVVGTKGRLKVHAPFWCPTKLETPTGVLEFPLPAPYKPTNFANSSGMCYEADAVAKCIRQGEKESSVMPLSQTKIVAEIMEAVMEQLGVIYYQEK